MEPLPPRPLDANRFASTLEAAQIRESIAADEALLGTVSARLASSEVILHGAQQAVAEAQATLSTALTNRDTLLSLHAKLADSLHERRGFLHPIRNLPVEVTSEIFSYYLEALLEDHEPGSDEQWHAAHSAPYTLGQVCRRWREIVRSTPRLWIWAVIQFEHIPSQEWLLHLSSRIGLAGALPLRLLMCGPFPPYDDDELDALPPGHVSPREVWDTLLPFVQQCSQLRVYVRPDDAHSFATHRLMSSEAAMLEDVSVRLTLEEGSPIEYWALADTPAVLFNMRASNLQRIELAGMLSSNFDPQDLVVYPKVTQAKLDVNKDFTAADVSALLQRFPALEQLEPGAYCIPRGATLAWFAHPTVRRIVLPSSALFFMDSGIAAGPQTFPRLEAADLGRIGTAYLTTLFGASGALHAIRTLSLVVGYCNNQLVEYLDLLPRLESACLRGGVLTRNFAVEPVWTRGQAWRCPTLQHLTLEDVKEVQPVDPARIVSWLQARNSAARDGAHAALRTFSIGWQSRPESFTQRFEDDVRKALST